MCAPNFYFAPKFPQNGGSQSQILHYEHKFSDKKFRLIFWQSKI